MTSIKQEIQVLFISIDRNSGILRDISPFFHIADKP